ncbi:unnamed protein product [Cuscuta epithymum]|uniref:RING-CH-type domain-containing protein n=1 Tax=Cuscuta epithymum TaxID=186058 RepID=A0AAV0F7A8_9ASTE|nr:unnamed protein product [Cuscuta epithymum]CAH9131370.1 unnamed protein product [Cuscuta epithymum]
MNGEVQLEPLGGPNPSDSDPLLNENREDPTPPLSSESESSNEIRVEDLETGSLPCCRICLECDGQDDDDLISPCMCKGTQQFVHRTCLDHWRSVKEGFAFSHCTTCKAQFHLRVAELEDSSWRNIKFRLFVARDIFLVFLAVQSVRIWPSLMFALMLLLLNVSFHQVIAVIGGFAYLIDKDGTFRNSFNDSWDRILSKHPIPFYYCLELLLWLGHLGLLSCINGSMLRLGYHFRSHLCYHGHCVWVSCCHHGIPKDLAEALSHSD